MNVGSGVKVIVGVGLCSKVGVKVTVGVASGAAIWPEPRRTRKMIPPPMARRMMSKPIANGKLSVSSGSFWERTVFAFLVSLEIEKVRPHTRHLVAFSLRRVPQVGQVLE